MKKRFFFFNHIICSFMYDIHSSEIESKNNDRINELQKKLSYIQQTRDKKVLKPNWPSFFPFIHYNPSELIHPFDDLINRSFRAFIFVIITLLYNLFTLTHVDLSCFSLNRSLFLCIIQGFAAIYFCYAYSYRFLYCACLLKHIPYRFVFYQFCLIFWNIYILIGFCQTGFAGISTLFSAVTENGEDDIFSILLITSNCIILTISLILHCLTLSSASDTRSNSRINYNIHRKINESKV